MLSWYTGHRVNWSKSHCISTGVGCVITVLPPPPAKLDTRYFLSHIIILFPRFATQELPRRVARPLPHPLLCLPLKAAWCPCASFRLATVFPGVLDCCSILAPCSFVHLTVLTLSGRRGHAQLAMIRRCTISLLTTYCHRGSGWAAAPQG